MGFLNNAIEISMFAGGIICVILAFKSDMRMHLDDNVQSLSSRGLKNDT